MRTDSALSFGAEAGLPDSGGNTLLRQSLKSLNKKETGDPVSFLLLRNAGARVSDKWRLGYINDK